jgi:N-acetylmuramoyl-L-alanine amidase
VGEENNMTYEQFKEFMIQYESEKTNDTTLNDWARDARKWAVENGISDGTMPQGKVKREECWTMLYRYNNLKRGNEHEKNQLERNIKQQ